MNSFGYLRDRLFLAACSLYALNRWGLKPRVQSAFLHDHFNDLLLIPCALPPLLLLLRWLRLRPEKQPPRPREIALYLLVWSILFELVGPRIRAGSVGDPWDVVAYCAGGACAGLWWHYASHQIRKPKLAVRNQFKRSKGKNPNPSGPALS